MKINLWLAMGIGAIVMIASTVTFANTPERVITITSDAFDGTFAINVSRDNNGAITEILYQTPTTPNGVLTVSQMRKGPQVIFSKSGHDVILLSAESDFDPKKGGHVIMRYLNSGMDDTYKDFRVLLDVEKTIVLRSDPNSNDPDSDNNSYTGVFDQLFLAKNTGFLGIVVGIDQVVPSYH